MKYHIKEMMNRCTIRGTEKLKPCVFVRERQIARDIDRKKQRGSEFNINTLVSFPLKSATSCIRTSLKTQVYKCSFLFFYPLFVDNLKQYLALWDFECSYFWICYHCAENLFHYSPLVLLTPNLQLGANPNSTVNLLIWKYIMLVRGGFAIYFTYWSISFRYG